MAKHCGWDKDFIADRFTLDQLRLYFRYLSEIEVSEQRKMAVAVRAAQLKEEDFNKFLDDGKGIRADSQQGIDLMRREGLIEEQ